MTDRKKSATKAKSCATGQRTLLDLFPLKKTEKPPTANADADSSSIDGKTTQLQNDHEQDLVSEGCQPIDIPPDSPIIISEAPSTPSSQHIVIENEEAERQAPVTGEQGGLEGSQEDPIIIDYSPPGTKVQRDTPKKLWSIFAPRVTLSAKPARRGLKSGLGVSFPSAETQHVRGPQTTYSSALNLSRCSVKNNPVSVYEAESGIRQFLLQEEEDECLTKLEFDVKPCKSEEDRAAHLGMIPEEQKRSHPVLDKLTSTGAEHIVASSAQLWTDKWRPECAAEVLGNEKSALYLRDWLRTLALEIDALTLSNANQIGESKGRTEQKGVKRPRIIRAVNKWSRKRRRVDSDEEDDSWIVYDDESEEEAPPDGEQQDTKDKIDTSPEQHTFGRLTNTIILTGPPGCGKTACVYACAKELNWEVFEVYPGIGKRNGASIDNLIGDVGKNHLVRKATGIRGVGSTRSEEMDGPAVIPRQSLVLLEEVDILFKEDSNFWPTVVNFLRDCKRPVVCTCNDISLVPTLELPVQSVLVFEPCPPTIAASYLQAVCCNEGWLIDHDVLRQLYEMPFETFADGRDPLLLLPAPDLRRTMHKLQLWCSTVDKNNRVSEASYEQGSWPTGDDGRSIGKTAELLSYLDGEKLCHPWSETSIPSADDEVGHTILFEEGKEEGEFGDGYADRGVLISCAATRLARGGNARGYSEGGLFRARMGYQRQMREALGRLVPRRETACGRTAVYTEYAAYVRQMVAGEDAQEAQMQTVGGGRATRNSRRYWRTVEVSGAERAGLGW